MLPDEVLLEIFDFDFYVDKGFFVSEKRRTEEWITLAHVCRRWRSVVFQSPHRLNLRLLCTPKTHTRDNLDIWPAFLPLIIRDVRSIFGGLPSRVDNIIPALERNDRVRQIKLVDLPSSELEYLTDLAKAIPGADRSASRYIRRRRADASRFVLGRNRTTSAITLLVSRSISGITQTTFVRNSPRPS
jgi:hypothetical protein